MATVDIHHPDPGSVPVRDAATVIVVRQAEQGIQVCMLQRNLKSDFVGGAYVFPGGAVDPEDSHPAYRGLLSRDLPHGDGSEGDGLEFRVAAARESFEEAGILFARGVSLDNPDPVDSQLKERLKRHRQDVDSGTRQLHEICAEEGLSLDLAGMLYMSRWVTPFGAPRRYDTRFFVAEAPAGQEALHDDREVIDTIWITPDEALRDARSGRRTMIFPTFRTMVALSRFKEVAELLSHVAGIGAVAVIEPVMRVVGERLEMELPGDPEGVGGKYDALSGEPLSAS